jgi:hypothetical protein
MFLGDRIADNKPLSLSNPLKAALAISVAGVLFVGVWPQPFIKLAMAIVAAWSK